LAHVLFALQNAGAFHTRFPSAPCLSGTMMRHRSASMPVAVYGSAPLGGRQSARRHSVQAGDFQGGAGDFKILCFGDSLTAGFHAGGRAFEPYGNTLSDELRSSGSSCRVSVCGLSGLTAGEMVQNMSNPTVWDVVGQPGQGLAVLLQSSPDLVIIMAGTNDIGKGMGPKAILGDLAALHAECHARGVPTVALAPSTVASGPSRLGRDTLARLLQTWSRATPGCIAYLDMEDLVDHSGRTFWDSDGLHLSAMGSRALGHRLLPHIKSIVDKGRAGEFPQAVAQIGVVEPSHRRREPSRRPGAWRPSAPMRSFA